MSFKRALDEIMSGIADGSIKLPDLASTKPVNTRRKTDLPNEGEEETPPAEKEEGRELR